MDTKKDVKQLIRKLRRGGHVIDERGKHYKVRTADGAVLFGISRTPSDPLAWKRILADVRRTGWFGEEAA
jgi:hypothetical protein